MNNLVKFLILSFLILWPASLNADSKPSAYIKCDLERDNGRYGTQKRGLIVELDVANKYYYALQWQYGSKHIGHFWRGENSLSLLGDNDEFYLFDGLELWNRGYSEEMLIKTLELIPLRADNGLNDAFLSLYFSFQNIGYISEYKIENSLKGIPINSARLNRETLELVDPTAEIEQKCRLIDEKAADAAQKEMEVLFEDNWTEALKRNEELEAKKEEQRERFKL